MSSFPGRDFPFFRMGLRELFFFGNVNYIVKSGILIEGSVSVNQEMKGRRERERERERKKEEEEEKEGSKEVEEEQEGEGQREVLRAVKAQLEACLHPIWHSGS